MTTAGSGIKRVLLFGANGQLGWELQRHRPEAVELCALSRTQADIAIQEQVEQAAENFQPDLIINAAAYTAVDLAESESETAYAINRDGAVHCAEAARKHSARLIHISTDFVFDGSQATPYQPDSIRHPLGVYGASKAAGEIEIVRILGNNALILRTAWVYSTHGKNFVKTMLRLMSERDSLGVVGDQIGSPTWAAGLAAAIWRACAQPEFNGIQHWTDAGVASWYDFAVAIQEEALALGLLQRSIPIGMIPASAYPTPARRPACAVLDKSISYATLGAAPHWRQALRQMLTDTDSD
ncbi:dTDP-4-dehydrorhamnose reductase [Acidithiobacillus thiooxidans]|uniref:dTDP-4-dehydrorhamnose reductase n=1 Tax=Acidithiobacillus thiooxidans ATCC 19377 TaxID=637390 RepID=A0A543Q1A0_ACITH|nr:dTDP-4-dehydrorhamnose reductase [Acidithiobacillus thiooxidans]MDR7925691.1 dTDP-4-dehydrorhamnose reductase [Acidithiobacillus thiooxidans]MDX5933188.1 dTDP-4-dehydrorhamnose reductase [Acidithiobacillus thiooxidans]TQN50099.1 dTDP-4-dehydrorhamnose reductase [Acidithiobacillus thiooxidans ATCC 19377]